MAMQLVTSLPREVVQTQLARIVDSWQFRNAPRLRRFLTYVVKQGLAGQSDRLNGYTIGLEVFDKETDFDPQTDTIVRVQARTLRQKLDQYYAQDGVDDPVHITIPKGGYEPSFLVSFDGEEPKDRDADPSPPLANRPSIAVLPFECIGPKTENDFLCVGLTEGTISNLSRFKDLSVFSRSSMEKARQDQLSISGMYKGFRPDFVLEGNFRIRDDLIEAQIKLIDAATNEVLMTDIISMRMDAGHIYEMQDDMVARIAARIAVEHGPIGFFARGALRSGPAIKWETYAWILRYFQFGMHLDQAARDDVEAGLATAARNDPTSSDVHAALALIKVEQFRALTEKVGDPATLARAMEHALLAVRHNPLNAMAHQSLALANFHSRRFVDFRASVRRALQLNPGHSKMLAMFGLCFVRLGEFDEANTLLDRAFTLNPLHPSWQHLPKAMSLMMTKGPREAIAELEANPVPDVNAFHFPLLWFQVEAGNMDAALREKERLLAVTPELEKFTRRYFDAICLRSDIADRAIAAAKKVGLNIAG